MQTVLGVAVVGGLGLGWLVLVVAGLIAVRKQQRGVGIALIVVGGLWGVAVLAGGGLAYYYVQRAGDVSKTIAFDPATYQGKMGTFTTKWQGASSLSLRVNKGKGAYSLSSSDGTFRVPAGSYAVQSWTATSRAKSGPSWTLRLSSPKQLQDVTVGPDETFASQLGSPLTAKIAVGRGAKASAAFDLEIEDAGGNACSVQASGKGVASPKFEALDEAGKVVWSGKFEYG